MAFIVFEGLDGAGKSTLIRALSQNLERLNQTFVLTREPGGTRLGDEIRQLLLRTQGEAPIPRAELLLYQAGRAQHVDCVIGPALKKGQWVLCDRYSASSIAFQCGGRNMNQAEVEWLNNYSTGSLVPDLWVLLDLDADTAKARMAGRELDRFELEHRDFHQRVRDSYLRLAKAEPAKWLVLSALDTPEQLEQKLISEMQSRGLLKEK
jgi:dTMP kinase